VRFFHDHWARDHHFLGWYPLAARPPLANVVTVAFIAVTGRDFAHFQVISALFACLAFIPAGLLARRFGRGPAAIGVLVVFLMLNPMFIQNATFTWTKLPTVFFILAALYFYLRAHEPGAPAIATWLFALSLAAGLLAHYSAGPYAVLFGLAWVIDGWRQRRERAWWNTTAFAALAGAVLLGTWFGWSIRVYGARETFFSNTSVTAVDADRGHQLTRIVLNLRDTIVPHFLRHPDPAVVAQNNLWGTIRDWFFQSYQVNLLFITGSIGWLVILRELCRAAIVADAKRRRAWAAFIIGSVVIGVAVHGARDEWGLAHICLLPLGVLGLAFLAARWPLLSRPWRIAAAAGVCVDFVAGIAFHFAVQNYALDRWFPDGRSLDRIMLSYTRGGQANIVAKAQAHLVFFADTFPVPATITAIVLALLLGVALVQARRVLMGRRE
jgi:4-amino-4-deoxy-L-arabinose transferase-like glycosyltransferase